VLLAPWAPCGFQKTVQRLETLYRYGSGSILRLFAAEQIFQVVGEPASLEAGDARTVDLPWRASAGFGVAYLEFGKLHREANVSAPGVEVRNSWRPPL